MRHRPPIYTPEMMEAEVGLERVNSQLRFLELLMILTLVAFVVAMVALLGSNVSKAQSLEEKPPQKQLSPSVHVSRSQPTRTPGRYSHSPQPVYPLSVK